MKHVGRLLQVLTYLLVSGLTIAAAGEPPDYRSGGTVHVAAIQLTEVPGGIEANLDNAEELVRRAAARGAKYILLPEYLPGQMVVEPGMSLEEVRANAQPLDGAIAKRLLALAKELDVYLGFPLGERAEDGRVYNSTVYAGPDGISGVYRKTALIHIGPAKALRERDIYTKGEGNGVINWGGIRIGALICADGGFDNLYRVRAKQGVQLFTHASSSWGVKKEEATASFVARKYATPVIFANKYRVGLMHQGNTQIVDATGKILAHVGPEANVVIDAELEIPPLGARQTSRASVPGPRKSHP